MQERRRALDAWPIVAYGSLFSLSQTGLPTTESRTEDACQGMSRPLEESTS